MKRGLKLIMDVESFDYAYFPRGSRGFKVALSDGRDKAVINQEGFYVAPGTKQLINPPRKKTDLFHFAHLADAFFYLVVLTK